MAGEGGRWRLSFQVDQVEDGSEYRAQVSLLLRWGWSCKLGPEAGGLQTPDWQLPAMWPEPVTTRRGLWEPGPHPSSPLKPQWDPRLRMPWASSVLSSSFSQRVEGLATTTGPELGRGHI